MVKKIVISVIVVLLLGAGGYWYFTYRSAQTAQAALSSLTTAPLERGELVETVSATGKVRPNQTTSLTWQTTGTVDTVEVKVGDKVDAGHVLARLKQTSLPQGVITAQATLIEAKEALDDLTTQAETSKTSALEKVMQLEADLRDAQYQLDNFTVPVDQASLSTTEALTKTKQKLEEARKAFEPYKYYPSSDQTREDRLQDLNDAQASYNSAVKRLQYESELEVAQANLDQAWKDFNKYANGPSQEDIQMAQAKVDAAQATLSQAWLEAPFAGTITQVNIKSGDKTEYNSSTSSSAAAFRLDDLESLFVDLDVSEIDVDKVQIGQEAEVTLDAIPQAVYHGKVTEIAKVSTTSSGAVNFTVTVQVTDADARVRPGMTSEVKIFVGKQENVLLVPLQAIQTEKGQQVVYVQQPGQAPTAVPVELGISSDEYSALVSGEVKEGDPVVLNPAAMNGTTNQGMMFGPGPGGPGGGGRRNNGGNGGGEGEGGGQP